MVYKITIKIKTNIPTAEGEGSFRDTEESAVLTRAWRLSKETSVQQFHKGSKEWLAKRRVICDGV